ncbi:hypothetical protein COCNU_01G012460 [Cocos nucifera]|uniref:DUF1664 domain-containing protein n=1 Tax=Cocos nucifera TaxID=13894 RepID=A0A8K0MUX9_COCNU|nr:hypothetical protein COCNU_01G012460 [Cocos nucifera]
MQAGMSPSKVLILVGAGLTGSVILRNGRLSDVLLELQELMKGIKEVEVSSNHYDPSLLAAQIRHLAQEVRDLTLSRPVAIFNGDSTSSGSLSSYIMPAAAVGAIGYCYMWWKGWSFSDVMFVTKRNVANAVANVSKQLEQISAALATTKKHLTQRLENLDGKLDEQKETSQLIVNEVNEVKTGLSQIGFDIESIQRMVSGLEGRIGLIENKQDITNAGIWYLCQFAGGIKEGLNTKYFQTLLSWKANASKLTCSFWPLLVLHRLFMGKDFPSLASDFICQTFIIMKPHENCVNSVHEKGGWCQWVGLMLKPARIKVLNLVGLDCLNFLMEWDVLPSRPILTLGTGCPKMP